MIAASTRSKNACIGNKAASAEELWTGSVPKFAHDLETQGAVKALDALRFLSALSLYIKVSSLAITLFVDSLGLRDGVGGHSRQSDGSVMIDVAYLRESYHNQELKIAWCPTGDMLADP
jgi:hypothetical protein